MNILTPIIPITQARSKFGNLINGLQGESYVVLTKGGIPRAALVDYNYLVKLEEEVRKIYNKTFIQPDLLPLTREFSNEEIVSWRQEDALR